MPRTIKKLLRGKFFIIFATLKLNFTIMAVIIGRKTEISVMEKVFNSEKAEFLVIYGRRRVGKTYLVREFFNNNFDFQHTGLSPLEYENETEKLDLLQRSAFVNSLKSYGFNCETVPSNWLDVFELLKQHLILRIKQTNNKRITVFIDEMPWMDSSKNGFLTAFESFWNGWGAGQEKLLLIVCGSATSWISDNLINNNGGLYGRVTREIKLSPFNLSECEDFFKYKKINMSRYDQLQSYMIFGGIPYYLGYLERDKSLAQNVDSLFFATNGALKYEFERLFNSLFRKSNTTVGKAYADNFKNIVTLLSNKREGYTRKEISENTKIPYGGGLTDILRGLESSDFIRPYLFYKGNQREVRYKLTDFFVLFYLKFVNNATKSISYWQENQFSPSIYAWRGLTFEEVCWNHQVQLKNALGIASVKTIIAPWRSQKNKGGSQIDLVIERSDHIINVCEMKFKENAWNMTDADEQDIRSKVADFIEETKYKHAVQPVLVSSFGVQNNAYSSVFSKIITMDELFK